MEQGTGKADGTRPVVVEPIGCSPVGVYVVRGEYSEREARAVFEHIRGRLGHGDVLLVMKPGESLEAMSAEDALTLHRHLGERLACITPATSRG